MNTHPPLQEKLIKTYDLPVGIFYIYQTFVIGELNEGVSITLNDIYELVAIAEFHYEFQLFTYISHRSNSYSIDPTVYSHLKDFQPLTNFAVVSKDFSDRNNVKIERYFYGKKIELFYTLEEAIQWALSMNE